jgi:oligopeptide transport system permease protein
VGGVEMLKFVFKRFCYMIFTLWVAVTITFFMMHSIPGDPLATEARKLPEQIRINFYAKYGLDKPVSQQYVAYMKGLLKGDLGESIKYPGRNVGEQIKIYAPRSGRIGIQAVFLGFTIGIILGIIAAFNRAKWPDFLVIFIALLGVSVPSFVYASLLQYFIGFKFKLLPTSGYGTFSHTVLPSIALAFGSIATYSRYMRANTLDVINQDYILTAKAKGVGKFALVIKHVIRNSILPCITILGPQIGGVILGSFVIESIFNIPGLGQYFVASVSDRDYTMIMGQTVLVTSIYIVSLFAVDIIYGLIDPRIRSARLKA